jgi:hypothetical protein
MSRHGALRAGVLHPLQEFDRVCIFPLYQSSELDPAKIQTLISQLDLQALHLIQTPFSRIL